MKRDISRSPFKTISGWRGDSLACPQAFGGDIYAGCDYGCWWCFCREMEAEMYNKYYTGWTRNLVRQADPDEFQKLFDQAFGSDRATKNWSVSCLRQGLPFNMGSKSEPFAEPNDEKTIQILELFREYRVPVIFETKSVYVGLRRYFDIIKDLHAAVIISVMGGSDTLNYRLEPGAPVASSRWQLVKDLNAAGVWCGVRWEPILPTINASDSILRKYAENAKRYGAKHVSLYHYRSSNFYTAKEEFERRGFDYIRMLENSKDKKWKPVGQKLFDCLRKQNVPCSTPDFVNFPFDSDCISCCGTDELFEPYNFNYQYALRRIKTQGSVSWDDMEEIDFCEPSSYNRMKEGWNGGGQYFGLADCVGVVALDRDANGFKIYGAADGAIQTPKRFDPFDLGV